MQHPFDLDLTSLKLIDLDFAEPLVAEQDETALEGSGRRYTTLALGEEGGYSRPPRWKPEPTPPITTLALSEEGGHPPITTLALGEEGGSY
ncbi:MAG: hypothetical protein IGS50_12975 [Synechococcales cyanobacterium C42_A2020_086]|nr:hypothetical protein [Synechococcales cyanobacterium C42_A2020_086]